MPGFGVDDASTARAGGLTYADDCALPDDGLRDEISEGNLVGEPSPRTAHPFRGLALPLGDLWE